MKLKKLHLLDQKRVFNILHLEKKQNLIYEIIKCDICHSPSNFERATCTFFDFYNYIISAYLILPHSSIKIERDLFRIYRGFVTTFAR